MKRMKVPITAAVALTLATMVGLSGCDTASTDMDASASLSESSGEFATLLIADLALSGTQESQVAAVFEKYGDGRGEPGALWYVAADLQERLTDEQKQRLFDKAAEGPGDGLGRDFGQGSSASFRGQHAGQVGMGGGVGQRRRGDGSGPLGDILTDEQKEQAKAIRESVREQLQAIRDAVDAGTLTSEEAREQVRAIHDSVRDQIEALLTDEQKAQIEALRAEREAEREQTREAARAVRNEVLGLGDEAAASFDEIFEAQRAAADEIREQVRNGELTRDEAHAAILSLRDDRYTELDAILDETQLEIVKIHDALATRMRHHGMRGGLGQGSGMRPGAGGAGQFSGSGFGFGSRG